MNGLRPLQVHLLCFEDVGFQLPLPAAMPAILPQHDGPIPQ